MKKVHQAQLAWKKPHGLPLQRYKNLQAFLRKIIGCLDFASGIHISERSTAGRTAASAVSNSSEQATKSDFWSACLIAS